MPFARMSGKEERKELDGLWHTGKVIGFGGKGGITMDKMGQGRGEAGGGRPSKRRSYGIMSFSVRFYHMQAHMGQLLT